MAINKLSITLPTVSNASDDLSPSGADGQSTMAASGRVMAADDPCEDTEDNDPEPRRRLTRQEQLEGLADRGCDTWEDYRDER